MRPEILFSLFAEISTLKGIGSKTVKLLQNLLSGSKIVDLAFHLPALTDPTDRGLKTPYWGVFARCGLRLLNILRQRHGSSLIGFWSATAAAR